MRCSTLPPRLKPSTRSNWFAGGVVGVAAAPITSTPLSPCTVRPWLKAVSRIVRSLVGATSSEPRTLYFSPWLMSFWPVTGLSIQPGRVSWTALTRSAALLSQKGRFTSPLRKPALWPSCTVGGETVQDGQSAGFLKGLVNLPFWDNKAALRVSAVQETLPGWIDNPVTGQKDINHGEKYSVRGSLLVAPTSDLTIRLTAFNQGLTVHGDNGVEVIGAAATPTTPPANQFDLVDGFSRGGNVEHRIENALEYYALNVDYAFHAATLMSATSYGKIRYRTTGDFTNDNLAPGVTYGDYLGSFFAVPVAIQENEIEFVHKFNQEFRLTSNPGTTVFGKPLDWVLGAFYTREATDLNQPLNGISLADGTIQPTVVNGLLLGGGDITASYKETAYFADVTYHFAPAFDIELGGRSTLTQQHQHSTFTGLLYQGGEVFGDLYSSQTSTTWSVAPRWHITSDVLMYARFATGFRPGGPNIPTPTLPMPPAFLADSTRNYELGLRADLLGRAVTIDVAAFDVEWKNIQI